MRPWGGKVQSVLLHEFSLTPLSSNSTYSLSVDLYRILTHRSVCFAQTLFKRAPMRCIYVVRQAGQQADTVTALQNISRLPMICLILICGFLHNWMWLLWDCKYVETFILCAVICEYFMKILFLPLPTVLCFTALLTCVHWPDQDRD